MDDLSQPGSEAAAAAAANGAIAADEVVGLGAGRSVFAPAPAPQVPLPGQGPISRGQLLAPGFYAPAFYGAGPSGVGGALPELPARHLVNLSKSDSTISSQITQMLRGGEGGGAGISLNSGAAELLLRRLGNGLGAVADPFGRSLSAGGYGGMGGGGGGVIGLGALGGMGLGGVPRNGSFGALSTMSSDTSVAGLGFGGGDDVKPPKARFVWSPELHQQFEAAVLKLGVHTAKPQSISQLMNCTGENAPTRQNIKSHLQKYRLLVKKREDEASARPPRPPDPPAPPPPRPAAAAPAARGAPGARPPPPAAPRPAPCAPPLPTAPL